MLRKPNRHSTSENFLPYIVTISDRNHQVVVQNWLTTADGPLQFNPDQKPQIHWFNQDKTGLKIDTVREVITQAALSATAGYPQVFVLCYLETAQAAAQNALLKTLEEPNPFTFFILTTTQPSAVLPTIYSRCVNLTFNSTPNSDQTTTAAQAEAVNTYTQLLAGSYSTAITLAGRYSDREQAIECVEALINIVHDQPATAQTTQHLKTLLSCHEALNHNVNAKLALENAFFALRNRSWIKLAV